MRRVSIPGIIVVSKEEDPGPIVSPRLLRKGGFLAVAGQNRRPIMRLLGGAAVATLLPIIGALVTASMTDQVRELPLLLWGGLLVFLNFLNLLLQARSREESPESIKTKVSKLASALPAQVRSRSIATRRDLIKAPLEELALDITPRSKWVRDPALTNPEPIPENADIATAFEAADKRLLIVGMPGSGKTMAAYSLIEDLDKSQGVEGRIPLLVNLSAWEGKKDFGEFLVDYLCSSVGYRVSQRSVAFAFVGA